VPIDRRTLPRPTCDDYSAAVQDTAPNIANPWPRWRAYVLAFVVTFTVLVLRLALAPWVGDRPLLVLFVFPVLLAAYFGGIGPGLLATVLVGLTTAYFVLPPYYSLWIEKPLDFAQWLFLMLLCVLVSVLFEELQVWRDRTGQRTAARREAATERKVRAGFVGSLAFLGAIGIVSYLSVVSLNDSSRLVEHSHEVTSRLDQLLGAASAAEAAQRGFVINGDEKFVDSFERTDAEANGLLVQLKSLVADSAEQTARIKPLEDALNARIARSREVIALRRAGGFEAAQRDVAPGRGEALQLRVHERVDAIRVAELKLLGERQRRTRLISMWTQGVIVGGSVLALIFVSFAWFAIRRDIAGRERAESELDQFFSLSLDFMVISSADGFFKRVSPAVTDILGWTPEEFISTPYLDFVHPDDLPKTIREVEKQMKSGEHVLQFENRYKHKNGLWRTLSWRSVPQGDLMYATARDVTDASAAANALREARDLLEVRVAQRTADLETANDSLKHSERRFRALIENGADGIALVDRDNKILYLSPAVTTIEGYSAEELVGRMGPEYTHPDDLPLLKKYFEQLMEHPNHPIPVLWRRRHKDGRWLWLEGVATNLLDDPAVGAIVTNYRDVSERIHSDTRMREQLQRLALLGQITRAIGERLDLRSIFQVVIRTIEDELPVDFCCICLYDAGENQLTVSCVGALSADLALSLGMTENAVVPIDENGLSRCVRGELVYEPDITATTFPFPRRLASASLRSMVIAPLLVESQVFGVLVTARKVTEAFSSGECEFLRQASEHTALAAHQVQLYDALQRAYDDLRQTQQQVMQQERLRALGQMASGIAHDINNAISPVALYTEALLEREQLSDRARSYLEIIQRAVDDVAQTVARMGEFYRLREPQTQLVPVDLNKLVRQVIDLTRARWADMAQQRGAVVEVHTELDADLPPIAAVESQIRDALVNLVFNAVDAMPLGGPLTIRTRSTPVEKLRIVQLEVTDSGIGMDEDTRRRCLEPFFTTKGTRGTGLGLAMVYGVAQRHGANLDIKSEVGKGTTVCLSFSMATISAASPAQAAVAVVGPQAVLIVDDDPLLLKSLRDALEADGHIVTIANGGQAGIDTFLEAHGKGTPFSIVITDLGMPHVDGRKVATAIKAASPTTVVLMLTGWGRRLVAEGDIPPGVDEVLSKPPKLAELRTAFANHLK
jgi:PAS domain S-box-containing protein